MWFIDNAWVAEWATFALVGFAEGTILYLLIRYLRGFLGGMTPQELRVLRWKLKNLTELSESDKVKMEEELKNGGA